MYTTIEPRKIALLNNDSFDPFITPSSMELPPLHDPNITKVSGRLLLEPNTSTRSDKPSSLVSQHTPSIPPLDDKETSHHDAEDSSRLGKESGTIDRGLGSSSAQSLQRILDDDNVNTRGLSSKKRRIEDGKDDFVQLPKPPKKQKSNKQVVPPIIIGLFEPPPQATLFPPISSSSFHDSHGRNTLNCEIPTILETKGCFGEDIVDGVVGDIVTIPPVNDQEVQGKAQEKKHVKARRRWSEEETNNLLLGAHKHGVGNWTDILEDPSFSFNNRSAADLKDRFRTCCPDELRGQSRNPKSRGKVANDQGRTDQTEPEKPKSGILSENLLLEEDQDLYNPTPNHPSLSKSDLTELWIPGPYKKSRSHRKQLTDLAELGIQGPFKKSERRERRPFSEQDDREIVEGYNLYGPAWTKIQRDARFHLQSRQPTDLRDRYRNKHLEKFRLGEDLPQKDSQKDSQNKSNLGDELTITNPPLTKSVISLSSSHERLKIHQMISSEEESTSEKNTASTKSNTSGPQPTPYGFKDNLPFEADDNTVEPADSLTFSQSFDWGEGIAASFNGTIGEMDILRLLE